MSIVIVGGGLAGATVVDELRAGGYDGHVVLFAAEHHLPYERPPLSKGYLLGHDPIDKAFVHPETWYREQDIDLRTGSRVTAVDLDNYVVRSAAGEQEYDKLILATGAQPRRFPLADSSGRPVAYLRTIEDSRRLKDAFAARPKIVIVGAGWIGLEVAAAAREAGATVTVHDVEDLPLLRVLGPEVAEVFADLHRAHGVDLRLGAAVEADDLADADLVVVGVGAQPDTELAERAGLAVDNGVLVDSRLRTSHTDVFAIGDIANHDHPTLQRRLRVEHWDNAIQQARVAARNALGAEEEYDRQPYFFTDQYDLGFEYVGNPGPAGYDDVVIEGDKPQRFRAYWLRDGVVVAAAHVNDWDASDAIRASVGDRRY